MSTFLTFVMRRYLKHLEGRLGREPLNDFHAPAIFSHEWDPTGTRLLVAGGPLLELIPGLRWIVAVECGGRVWR